MPKTPVTRLNWDQLETILKKAYLPNGEKKGPPPDPETLRKFRTTISYTKTEVKSFRITKVPVQEEIEIDLLSKEVVSWILSNLFKLKMMDESSVSKSGITWQAIFNQYPQFHQVLLTFPPDHFTSICNENPNADDDKMVYKYNKSAAMSLIDRQAKRESFIDLFDSKTFNSSEKVRSKEKFKLAMLLPAGEQIKHLSPLIKDTLTNLGIKNNMDAFIPQLVICCQNNRFTFEEFQFALINYFLYQTPLLLKPGLTDKDKTQNNFEKTLVNMRAGFLKTHSNLQKNLTTFNESIFNSTDSYLHFDLYFDKNRNTLRDNHPVISRDLDKEKEEENLHKEKKKYYRITGLNKEAGAGTIELKIEDLPLSVKQKIDGLEALDDSKDTSAPTKITLSKEDRTDFILKKLHNPLIFAEMKFSGTMLRLMVSEIRTGQAQDKEKIMEIITAIGFSLSGKKSTEEPRRKAFKDEVFDPLIMRGKTLNNEVFDQLIIRGITSTMLDSFLEKMTKDYKNYENYDEEIRPDLIKRHEEVCQWLVERLKERERFKNSPELSDFGLELVSDIKPESPEKEEKKEQTTIQGNQTYITTSMQLEDPVFSDTYLKSLKENSFQKTLLENKSVSIVKSLAFLIDTYGARATALFIDNLALINEKYPQFAMELQKQLLEQKDHSHLNIAAIVQVNNITKMTDPTKIFEEQKNALARTFEAVLQDSYKFLLSKNEFKDDDRKEFTSSFFESKNLMNLSLPLNEKDFQNLLEARKQRMIEKANSCIKELEKMTRLAQDVKSSTQEPVSRDVPPPPPPPDEDELPAPPPPPPEVEPTTEELEAMQPPAPHDEPLPISISSPPEDEKEVVILISPQSEDKKIGVSSLLSEEQHFDEPSITSSPPKDRHEVVMPSPAKTEPRNKPKPPLPPGPRPIHGDSSQKTPKKTEPVIVEKSLELESPAMQSPHKDEKPNTVSPSTSKTTEPLEKTYHLQNKTTVTIIRTIVEATPQKIDETPELSSNNQHCKLSKNERALNTVKTSTHGKPIGAFIEQNSNDSYRITNQQAPEKGYQKINENLLSRMFNITKEEIPNTDNLAYAYAQLKALQNAFGNEKEKIPPIEIKTKNECLCKAYILICENMGLKYNNQTNLKFNPTTEQIKAIRSSLNIPEQEKNNTLRNSTAAMFKTLDQSLSQLEKKSKNNFDLKERIEIYETISKDRKLLETVINNPHIGTEEKKQGEEILKKVTEMRNKYKADPPASTRRPEMISSEEENSDPDSNHRPSR
jgi:hypothetical protein